MPTIWRNFHNTNVRSSCRMINGHYKKKNNFTNTKACSVPFFRLTVNSFCWFQTGVILKKIKGSTKVWIPTLSSRTRLEVFNCCFIFIGIVTSWLLPGLIRKLKFYINRQCLILPWFYSTNLSGRIVNKLLHHSRFKLKI